MKESIKTYFKKMFTKKLVITKLIILAIAAVIVIVPGVCFYAWLAGKNGLVTPQNGFLYIYVVYNDGIAFSWLAGNVGGIFAIQSIVFIILLAVYWLLVTDRVSTSFVALAIFGGLFNLIQRASNPSAMVLDYFKFGFWPQFAVFNWPDVNVVIGVFGFVISYITHLILQMVKESKETATPSVPTSIPTEQTPVVEKPSEVRQI